MSRRWSVDFKRILEANSVHSCGMELNKPICDYMGSVCEHLLGGGVKPLKTIEAGEAVSFIILHKFVTYFT